MKKKQKINRKIPYETDLTKLKAVIIFRGIVPKENCPYKESPQWKPLPGTFSLLEVESFKDFFDWWKSKISEPYGTFKIREAGNLKPLGTIKIFPEIQFQDKGCTIYKYLTRNHSTERLKEQ